MRRWLVATGLGVLGSVSGCLEVVRIEPPAPECSDFSARSARAIPRPAITLLRPSQGPISARFSSRGEVRSLAGDFIAVGESPEEAALELFTQREPRCA